MIDVLRRRTKMIWSIDGSRAKDFNFDDLLDREVGALRVVYSQEEHENILKFLKRLKEYRSTKSIVLPLMLDMAELPQGIVAGLTDPKEVEYGDELTLSDNNETDINIKAENWESTFAVNEQIYFGFGATVLRVVEKSPTLLRTKVIHGGVVRPGAVIHVPATRQQATLNDLAKIDIKSFRDLGIDFVVLPGVTEREIALVRRTLSAAKHAPWLIVKVDANSVYEQLDSILAKADGVMICRRELALTINPALVPIVSKDIIQRSFERGRIVIMASEMLASMKVNPTPTRAEVSDIANAVIDGSDAVVLSEEIVAGSCEDRAYQMCLSIVEDLEKNSDVSINWQRETVGRYNELDIVAFHAYQTAVRLNASAIVCITQAGHTALRLASFRKSIPIVAVTFSKEVQRKLALVWGVSPIVMDLDKNLDDVLPAVNDLLKRESWLHTGDIIVFVTVTVSPVGREASNLFTIQKLD